MVEACRARYPRLEIRGAGRLRPVASLHLQRRLDEAPLEEELAVQADKLIGGPQAILVIDDAALPKKGSHSVGVGTQCASALGRNANCQTLVSLTLARDEVPVMIGLRLFSAGELDKQRRSDGEGRRA